MLTQDTHHPDMMDWEVEEDLRRARLVLRSRMRKNESSIRLDDGHPNPYSSPRAVHGNDLARIRTSGGLPNQKPFLSEGSAENHSLVSLNPLCDTEYPRSAQGGWRPWIFGLAGFIGGNIAMTLGGVSPSYLPTIIIAEIILGFIVCVAFYPRHAALEAS